MSEAITMAILRILAAFTCLCIAPMSNGALAFRKISSYPGYVRGESRDLVVQNNHAYLAMEEGGLCVMDVSNPSAPSIVSRLDLPGRAVRVKVSGEFAYVAAYTGGAHIVNIANPAAPILVSTVETGRFVSDVAVLRANLYVTEGSRGLVVYNITNPAAPRELSVIDTPGYAFEVVAFTTSFGRDMTVVADGNGGLIGWSISATGASVLQFQDGPLNPVPTDPVVRSVAYYDRLLHFATPDGYWRATVDPFYHLAFPGVVRPFEPLPNHRVFPGPHGLFMAVSPPPGVTSLIVSNISEVVFDQFILQVGKAGVAVAQTAANIFAIEASTTNGVSFGAFDPQFRRLGSINPNSRALRLKTSGNKAFLGNRSGQIEILEMLPNGEVQLRGTYPSHLPFDVFGDYLIVPMGGSSLHIVDVSDAANPRLVVDAGALIPANLAANITDVSVQNGRAYVRDAPQFGIRTFTFDLSDPANPSLVATNGWRSSLRPIVSGGHLFTLNGPYLASYPPNGDRFSTTALQQLDLAEGADVTAPSDMEIVGNIAYVCDGSDGLRLVDISNPAAMRLLSTFDTAGSVVGVHVADGKAYVADAVAGVVIVDVSNPLAPVETGLFATPNSARKAINRGDAIYVANDAEGLTVWKITELFPQTIDFPEIADRLVDAPNFQITARASSGLPVTLTISGPATIANGFVDVTGEGVVTIRATQAGNADYAAATAERTFTVRRVPQTITFAEFSDLSTIDDPFTFPAAAASSGLAVTYGISGPATLATRTITVTGAGEVRVTAAQAGNSTYAPASIERLFVVRELNDAVAFDIGQRNASVPTELRAPNADADSDGVPNVIEFLFRSDPTSATALAGRTSATIYTNASGSVYLRASTRRPRTTRYRTAVEVADLRQSPFVWRTFPASFGSDGVGSFLWPYAANTSPLIRLTIQYP